MSAVAPLVIRYEPIGGARELFLARDLEVCLDGPAGTGKTLAALNKLHLSLLKYPYSRVLVARKRNTDLAGSALATFREYVLNDAEGITYFGGNKVRPAAYQYPNGSEMIVNGLDKPGKVKSSYFDRALINEATECSVDDVEFVRSRLRHGKMSYHQLIMDVNPDAPTHWLNQRMNAGITRRILSRHQDNPRYWDREKQEWTPEGQEYIGVILEGLTGVRKSRLLNGIWAAAEGTVYEDEWDAALNVIDPFEIPKEWPRYWAIDFGYSNPFVCQFWARDPDGRAIMYREIYMTQRSVPVHCKAIMELCHWRDEDDAQDAEPIPIAIICDHDAGERATISDTLKCRGHYLATMPAYKAISEGIQATADRLKPAGDGRPRMLFFRDALVERDPDLMNRKLPCSTVEEFDGYIWATTAAGMLKEQPEDKNNHGMDAARYLASHLAKYETTVTYGANIWG